MTMYAVLKGNAESGVAAYATNQDGTAADAAAYREALRQDADKMAVIKVREEDVECGGSSHAVQISQQRAQPAAKGGERRAAASPAGQVMC